MDGVTVESVLALITPRLIPLGFAILVLVVGRIVAKILTAVLRKTMTKGSVDETLVRFTCNMAYIALMTFVILASLQKISVQTTSFIAIIGAAGLAVGLALQGSLSNFASGVLMNVFKPFKVGGFVQAGGNTGIVEEIGIFTTSLKTPDNKAIIVPNSKITDDTITNFSAKPQRGVDLVIGVSYSDDLKKVRSVLEGILNANEQVLKDPEYTIGVLELGDSSVNFAVRPRVNSDDYWPVLFDLTETIKVRFDAEKISIPFPQRDLHIVAGSASASSAA